MSVGKTKGMVVGQLEAVEDDASVQLDTGAIEMVIEFTYLGSIVSSDGNLARRCYAALQRLPEFLGV